ncbi:hypothetical protein ACJX0J_027113, partial [Zea mays]
WYFAYDKVLELNGESEVYLTLRGGLLCCLANVPLYMLSLYPAPNLEKAALARGFLSPKGPRGLFDLTFDKNITRDKAIWTLENKGFSVAFNLSSTPSTTAHLSDL